MDQGIRITVENSTELEQDFHRYLARLTVAMGDATHEYVDFVRSSYLSGQKLNAVSGRTRDSTGTWMRKKDRKTNPTWMVRPGLRVPGSLNYLGRWKGTEHEFMEPSFRAFREMMEQRIASRMEGVSFG